MRKVGSGYFSNLPAAGVVVIKVGTSSLVNPEAGTLKLSGLARIVEVVKELKDLGYSVVLVSSGAVGVGCQHLSIKDRPQRMAQKQALAAVGQLHLMRYYDEFFAALGMKCAQVLLANNNFIEMHQFLNAKGTFKELLEYGVTPIVNENDSVAVEEIRIGDNDTLSAKVAILVEADWLFLLTDVPCLYTSNPRVNPDAKPIHIVEDIRQLTVDVSSGGTQWGSGGMMTKLTAARLATAAGCNMGICQATNPEHIVKMMDGERVGTVFKSHGAPLSSKERKRWILSVPIKGQLWMDDGAVVAVRDRHKSLFAAGITRVYDDFGEMDAVSLCDKEGNEFAVGLVNYAHNDIRQVMGKQSTCFADELKGYGCDEMVHRQNICLLASGDDSETRS